MKPFIRLSSGGRGLVLERKSFVQMAQLAKKSYRRGKHTIKENWDSLLWIISMFATLYLTEFMSNVLFNPLVHRYI